MPVKVNYSEPKPKFLLDPGKKNTYYKGVFMKHEWFEGKYAGYYFQFIILSDIPLLEGEKGETSFGKTLRVTFWANLDEATGKYGFPKKGKFVNTCDILAESRGFDADSDEYDIKDLHGGVCEFRIVNEPSKKDSSISFSNIDTDSIGAIRESEIADVNKALERYKAEWKAQKNAKEDNDRGERPSVPDKPAPKRPEREDDKPAPKRPEREDERKPAPKGRKNPMEDADDELPF